MLTPEKLKKLREIAEDGAKRSYAPGFFPIFLNPETVLDLLDEIARLQSELVLTIKTLKKIANITKYVVEDKYDNSGNAECHEIDELVKCCLCQLGEECGNDNR